ncbi:CDC27 family protein [Sulfurospirillum oryzae]|uniref:CDC27 family protein n=1 Tax=Sulfurospirillum oryzae TaxID=2976535 RepID=UPI0021E99381|nr:CDC27 family protein [Sulfurospirillum oryzae]
MLSAIEITELEKKVLKYRLKQRLHYLISAVLILSIGFIGFFFYGYPTFSPQTKIKEQEPVVLSIAEQKIADINHTTLEQQPIVPDINSSTKYVPTPAIEEKAEQALLLQLPIIGKSNVEKKTSYTPDMTDKKTNAGIQEEELENKILMRKAPNTIDEESFYRSKEDKIDASLLPPPLLEEPKPKGVIKIETHEVNSIQYLKDKFEKTHNITFALMLAEEYYLTKNYNESNKWALIANNTDPENEKSWIWFAKSKLKLGHKEDAILALKAYLKNNKSKAAQSLLNQINVGEVID